MGRYYEDETIETVLKSLTLVPEMYTKHYSGEVLSIEFGLLKEILEWG